MQTDVLAPDAPPAAPAPACLNCATPLAGPFCAACGQSAATPERVTARSLWTNFRVGTLGLDRGLLVTVRDVLIRPGEVALTFVEGRRRTYVHPVAFLFVAYGVYAVVFGLIETQLMDAMTASMPAANPALSAAENEAAAAFGLAFMRFAVTYAAYLSVLTVLPFGLLLRTLLPASGRTVAECAVFALTVEAGVALVLGLVLNPLSAWTGSFGIAFLAYVLYFVLTGIGTPVFFGRQPQALVRALVAQALALVVYLVIVTTVGAVIGLVLALTSRGTV